jgi:hypothetical protein
MICDEQWNRHSPLSCHISAWDKVLTNPSKKQASQLICYHIGPQHHMWWVMFQLHCKMQILVCAEQHFCHWSCNKLCTYWWKEPFSRMKYSGKCSVMQDTSRQQSMSTTSHKGTVHSHFSSVYLIHAILTQVVTQLKYWTTVILKVM